MIYMSREKALKILNEPNGPEKLAPRRSRRLSRRGRCI